MQGANPTTALPTYEHQSGNGVGQLFVWCFVLPLVQLRCLWRSWQNGYNSELSSNEADQKEKTCRLEMLAPVRVFSFFSFKRAVPIANKSSALSQNQQLKSTSANAIARLQPASFSQFMIKGLHTSRLLKADIGKYFLTLKPPCWYLFRNMVLSCKRMIMIYSFENFSKTPAIFAMYEHFVSHWTLAKDSYTIIGKGEPHRMPVDYWKDLRSEQTGTFILFI